LAAFGGPKSSGIVTPQTLFRGLTAGDVIGPYVSQFLLKQFSYGPYEMNGLTTVPLPGDDYLTTADRWLASQKGQGPFGANQLDPEPRAIRNGRDLANYVHTDPNAGLFMSFYNAGIFLFEQNALLQNQNKASLLNPGNPYLQYKNQDPFGTFGVPFFLGLIGEAATQFASGGKLICKLRQLFSPPSLSRSGPAASLLSERPCDDGRCVRHDPQGSL
jgi:hypothetical protein